MLASTHIARLATAVLAVVAAMLLATTVSAVAQTSCEGRVLDTAGQLSSSDVADLTELTEELSAAGVKPFVRLLPTTESGIDAWLATSEAQCQAWRDADGRDPDLLVLAVSIEDRQTGTWFGDRLAPALDGVYLSVHEEMVEEFRRGNYGAALSLGISRYIEILPAGSEVAANDGRDAMTAPQPLTADDAAADDVAADDPTSTTSPLAREWLVLLVLAALGGGGWFALKRYRHHAEVIRLRGAVGHDRDGARQAYVTMDQHWASLVDASQQARERVAADDSIAVTLETERQQAVMAVQDARSVYIDAENAHDPEGMSSVAELKTASSAWQAVAASVEEVGREVQEVGGAMAHLEQAETAAAAALAEYETRRQRAQGAVDGAATHGFDVTELLRIIQQADVARAAGKQALSARRLGEGSTALLGAVQALTAVADRANDLPDRQRRLVSAHADLTAQRKTVAGQVEAMNQTVAQLRSSYARTVWDPVADAPAMAAQELAGIETALARAADAAGMDQQAFDDAEDGLARADAGLTAIGSMAGAVNGIAQDVEAAEREWEAERDEATTSLALARRFADDNRSDVSPEHLPALQRADEILSDAKRLAGGVRPDPLTALHRLREVDATSDAVLSRAQQERAVRDRARERARRTIRDADREVRRAESQSGLGLFGWSSSAKSSLQGCAYTLHRASDLVATDPEAAEREAAQVERQALDIIAQAQRRKDNNSYGSTGSGFFGGGGSSSGSSFSSGGSSSGSSSSSGGGSSSW